METGTVVILVVVALAALVATALALRHGGSFRLGLSRDGGVNLETAGPQSQARQRVDLANDADLSNAEVGQVVGAETGKPVDVTMLKGTKASGLKATEVVGYRDTGSSPEGTAPRR